MTTTDDNSASQASESAKPCPICGRPSVKATQPFCSKRCADVDLHRWLGERYAVPSEDIEPSDLGPEE